MRLPNMSSVYRRFHSTLISSSHSTYSSTIVLSPPLVSTVTRYLHTFSSFVPSNPQLTNLHLNHQLDKFDRRYHHYRPQPTPQNLTSPQNYTLSSNRRNPNNSKFYHLACSSSLSTNKNVQGNNISILSSSCSFFSSPLILFSSSRSYVTNTSSFGINISSTTHMLPRFHTSIISSNSVLSCSTLLNTPPRRFKSNKKRKMKLPPRIMKYKAPAPKIKQKILPQRIEPPDLHETNENVLSQYLDRKFAVNQPAKAIYLKLYLARVLQNIDSFIDESKIRQLLEYEYQYTKRFIPTGKEVTTLMVKLLAKARPHPITLQKLSQLHHDKNNQNLIHNNDKDAVSKPQSSSSASSSSELNLESASEILKRFGLGYTSTPGLITRPDPYAAELRTTLTIEDDPVGHRILYYLKDQERLGLVENAAYLAIMAYWRRVGNVDGLKKTVSHYLKHHSEDVDHKVMRDFIFSFNTLNRPDLAAKVLKATIISKVKVVPTELNITLKSMLDLYKKKEALELLAFCKEHGVPEQSTTTMELEEKIKLLDESMADKIADGMQS